MQWLGPIEDFNARVTRWFLALQPYRFMVKYQAGAQNIVADFLSLPNPDADFACQRGGIARREVEKERLVRLKCLKWFIVGGQKVLFFFQGKDV